MINKTLQRKLATSSIIISFLLLSISGLLMYFDVDPGSIRALHEFMSLIFVGAAMGHIFVNIKMFKRYLSESKLIMLPIFSLGALVFISAYDDLYMNAHAFDLLANSSLQQVASLQQWPQQPLLAWLESQHIEVNSWQQSILDIAKLNNTQDHEILEIIFSWPGLEANLSEVSP